MVKRHKKSPYKWSKSTVTKILTQQEYTGDLINFKTYTKSYKDKKKRDNPEENRKVFENNHEAIIDRETWNVVQEIRKKTKRRKPKNAEKNMFADILYCADCGSKLWFNVNSKNPDISFFNCSNYRGSRGDCNVSPTMIGSLIAFLSISLGFSAGVMIYVSTIEIFVDELLPCAREYGKHHHSIYGFILGMIVMAISLIMFI